MKKKFSRTTWSVFALCIVSALLSYIESIVTSDTIHWGLMFGPALDIKNGFIPHRETLVAYGIFTTWLQVLSLKVFGERLVSIGILTGFAYSGVLLISYLILKKILSPKLAFLATVVIFLIHPNIILPWSNYFAYLFQLLWLLIILEQKQERRYHFLAGFFAGLAILSRYSAILAIMPPVLLLALSDIFTEKSKKNIIKCFAQICGIALPIVFLCIYLLANNAFDDFWFQNIVIVKEWGRGSDFSTLKKFVLCFFRLTSNYASDIRGSVFTLTGLVCFGYCIKAGVASICKKVKSPNRTVVALSLVSVFGYLNALHLYETFRLVLGSSLGIGVLLYGLVSISQCHVNKTARAVIFVIGTLFVSYLGITAFTQPNSGNHFRPIPIGRILKKRMCTTDIPIFKGKILDRDVASFYEAIYNTINQYGNSLYIINYTEDCWAMMLNGNRKAQISPWYFPSIEDTNKLNKIVQAKNAIILAKSQVNIPAYSEILRKNWPKEIPWISGTLHIYAPNAHLPNAKQE